MISIKKLLLFFSFSVLVCHVYSQRFGLGASALYNFQTESFGYGIRAEFPKNNLSIVPQFSYYPSFNKINEYYIGLGFNYNILNLKRWAVYAVIHPGYNVWINYASSGMDKAKRSNYNLEGGIGIKTGKCFKPFLEFRYNIKWKESHLQAGFVYFFGCKKGKGYGMQGSNKRSKKGVCDAYN